MRKVPWIVSTAALSTIVLVVPSQASAPVLETGEVLAEAAWATTALAQDGIDVNQVITFSKGVNLFDALVPRIDARVPAGSTLRVHGAMAADRRTSYVVRDAKGRLIAGMGRASIADGGEWATSSAIRLDDDLEGFARDRGISRTTAITGLDSGRLGARAILGPYDAVTDVVNLVVPPYADQAFVWSTLSQGTDSSGRVVITGAIEEPDMEEDDPCTHVGVKAVIGARGAIEMAEWTDVCPGRGRVHFSATATFGAPVIDPPTRPRLTLDAAMARRSKGADKNWAALARATSRTMQRPAPGYQVTVVNERRSKTPRSWDVTYLIDGSTLGPRGEPSYSYARSVGPEAFGWNPVDGRWMTPPRYGQSPGASIG